MAEKQLIVLLTIQAQDYASKVIEQNETSLASLSSTLLATGTAMTAGLTLPIVGAGAALFHFASDWQTTMMEIQNNTNMSSAAVKGMESTIMDLGAQSGASLNLLAEGYQHAYNLTQSTIASQAELKVANEAAVATGDNVANTTNTLANAMHEYNLDTSNATTTQGQYNDIVANASHIMGVMHMATTLSNTTLDQWSQNTARATATAANLGIPIEQVSAVIATLSKHGFPDLAEAQTQAVSMMTHIIKPAAAAEKELQRLSKTTGVDLVGDFSAAGLSTKGFTGLMADLKEAYGKAGLSAAEQTQETMKLLNAQRGGLGMATLLGTGYADYNSILAALSDTEKVNTITEDQYQRSLHTAGVELHIAEQRAREMAIALGTALLPAMTSIISGIGEVASFLGNHLGPILQAMPHWVGTLTVTFAALVAVMGPLVVVGGAFVAVLAAVSGVVAAIGLAIAGLIAVVVTLYQNWDAIVARVPLLGVALNGVRDVILGVRDAIANAYGTISHFLSLAMDDLNRIGHVASGTMLGLPGWMQPIVPILVALVNAFGLARDAVTTFGMALSGNWIDNSKIAPLHQAIGELGLVFHSAGMALSDFARIGHVTSGTLLSFPPAIRPVIEILSQLGGWVLGIGIPSVERFAEAIARDFLTGIRDGIVVVRSFIDLMQGGFLNTFHAASLLTQAFGPQTAAQILNVLMTLTNGLNTVTSTIERVASAVTHDFLTGIRDSIAVVRAFVDLMHGGFANSVAAAGLLTKAFGPDTAQKILIVLMALRDGLNDSLAALTRFGAWLVGVGIPALVAFGTQAAHWLSGTLLPALLAFGSTALAGLTRFAAWLTSVGLPAVNAFGSQAAHWISGTLLPALLAFGGTALANLTRLSAWLAGVGLPAVVNFGQEAQHWIVGTLLPAIQTFGSVLASTLTPAWNNFTAALKSAWDILGPQLAPILQQVEDSLRSWAPILGDVVQVIEMLAEAALPGLIDGFHLLAGFVSEEASTLWPGLRDILVAVGEFITSALIVYLNVLAVFFRATLPAAIDLTIGIIKMALDQFKLIGDTVTGLVRIVVDLMHGDWAQAWADAKQSVVTMVTDIRAIFADAATWLLKAGSDFVAGFVNGIEGAIPGMISKVQGMASSAISAIKSFGRSPWPATIQNGIDFVQGFINGIGDTTPAAEKAAAEAASSVLTAFKDALDLSKSLQSFQSTGGKLPSNDLIAQLAATTQTMVQSLGESASTMSTDFVTAAKNYADAVKTGWDALDGGLKFASDYAKDIQSGAYIEITDNQISQLKFSSEHMVQSLGDSAALLGSDFVSSVSDYANAVKSGWDALGGALKFASDYATALSGNGVTFPPDSLVTQLKFSSEHLTQSLGDSAAIMSHDFVSNAQTYEKAVKDGWDALGGALKFAADYATALAGNGVVFPTDDFISQLKFSSEHLVQSLGDSAAVMSPSFVTAAETYGTAVKDGWDALGSAVKFAADYATALAGDGVIFPTDDFIDQVNASAQHLIEQLGQSGTTLGPDLAAAAQSFEGSAKTGFDALDSAVKFLSDVGTAMQNGVDLSGANLDGLVSNLATLTSTTLVALATVAQDFDQKLAPAAAAAGVSMQTASAQIKADAGLMKASFDVLGSALGFLEDATKFDAGYSRGSGKNKLTTPNVTQVTDPFVQMLMNLVQQVALAFQQAAMAMGTKGLNAAKQFATSVKPVIDLIQPALDAFKAMESEGVLTKDAAERFVTNFETALEAISALPAASEGPLKQARQFALLAMQIAAAISQGVEILKPFGINVTINGITVGQAGAGGGAPAYSGTVTLEGGNSGSRPISSSGGSSTTTSSSSSGSDSGAGSGPIYLSADLNIDGNTVNRVVDQRMFTNQRTRIRYQ